MEQNCQRTPHFIQWRTNENSGTGIPETGILGVFNGENEVSDRNWPSFLYFLRSPDATDIHVVLVSLF